MPLPLEVVVDGLDVPTLFGLLKFVLLSFSLKVKGVLFGETLLGVILFLVTGAAVVACVVFPPRFGENRPFVGCSLETSGASVVLLVGLLNLE